MTVRRQPPMTSLSIEFGQYRPVTARWWRLGALGVLLCISAIVMHMHPNTVGKTMAVPPVTEADPVPEASEAQRTRLNEALAHLAFDWPQALSRLEQSVPPGVALVSADWRGPTRELKLTGEALNTDAMLNFMDALKRDPLLQSLKLMRQEPARDETAAARIQFAVEGRLSGAAP